MAKEICISSTPHETRLAILEDDQLAEIYYERENEYTLAGSIYNGRVTRVLPGMQSAFVDIGLERDAFLYVTDFLELEDQEESDEIEKAAASNPNQAPREVRQGGERERGGRNGRGDRQPREARPAAEAEPAETEYILPSSAPAPAAAEEGSEDASGDPGAKRWRGRRRRRGGRGGAGAPEGESGSEEATETAAPAAAAAPVRDAHEIQAAATRQPRGERTPEPFVLPGESLTKYGGTPIEDEPKARPAMPTRPASTAKPSTMVVAPLSWDGSGLLPGESISRHRNRAPEPEPEMEAAAEISETPVYEAAQTVEALPVHEEVVEEELTREGLISEETSDEEVVKATDSELAAADPEVEVVAETEFEVDGEEPEEDASASHHVDPLPPSTFRLFGLGGGKKKKDEDEPHEAEAPVRETPDGFGVGFLAGQRAGGGRSHRGRGGGRSAASPRAQTR